MKAIITGANGTLGKVLSQLLQSKKVEVVAWWCWVPWRSEESASVQGSKIVLCSSSVANGWAMNNSCVGCDSESASCKGACTTLVASQCSGGRLGVRIGTGRISLAGDEVSSRGRWDGVAAEDGQYASFYSKKCLGARTIRISNFYGKNMTLYVAYITGHQKRVWADSDT